MSFFFQALLRPGRFDRLITIDPPTLAERIELFDMYLGKIKLDKPPSTYSQRLAHLTPGMSGGYTDLYEHKFLTYNFKYFLTHKF